MRCNTLLVTLMLSAVVAQAEREFWLIRKDPKDGPGHPENPGGSAGRINTNVILKEDDSAFNDCKSLQDMPELKSNVWKNKLEEPNTKVALDWWRFSSNNWHDSHSDDELFEYYWDEEASDEGQGSARGSISTPNSADYKGHCFREDLPEQAGVVAICGETKYTGIMHCWLDA